MIHSRRRRLVSNARASLIIATYSYRGNRDYIIIILSLIRFKKTPRARARAELAFLTVPVVTSRGDKTTRAKRRLSRTLSSRSSDDGSAKFNSIRVCTTRKRTKDTTSRIMEIGFHFYSRMRDYPMRSNWIFVTRSSAASRDRAADLPFALSLACLSACLPTCAYLPTCLPASTSSDLTRSGCLWFRCTDLDHPLRGPISRCGIASSAPRRAALALEAERVNALASPAL